MISSTWKKIFDRRNIDFLNPGTNITFQEWITKSKRKKLMRKTTAIEFAGCVWCSSSWPQQLLLFLDEFRHAVKVLFCIIYLWSLPLVFKNINFWLYWFYMKIEQSKRNILYRTEQCPSKFIADYCGQCSEFCAKTSSNITFCHRVAANKLFLFIKRRHIMRMIEYTTVAFNTFCTWLILRYANIGKPCVFCLYSRINKILLYLHTDGRRVTFCIIAGVRMSA